MSENSKEKYKQSMGKEREIILLGLLNIDNVYDKDWTDKKEEIKKDIETKAVKLNQAFRDPFYFHEHFEFLSAEDYQYVKNNYIYSAIVIFNPNIDKLKAAKRNEQTQSSPNGENAERNKGSTNTEEGAGVLVLTCKKMQKLKMKHMLIKMLKREIKVESVVLKKKEGSIYNNLKKSGDKIYNKDDNNDMKTVHGMNSVNNRENNNNNNVNNKEGTSFNEKLTKLEKHSDLKYLDDKSESYPFVTKGAVDMKVNNFFNMTAYLYGTSNVLTNTSLVQREYGDDEWAEKLRRKKKERNEMENGLNKVRQNNPHVKTTAPSRQMGGLIHSFTSLFKKNNGSPDTN